MSHLSRLINTIYALTEVGKFWQPKKNTIKNLNNYVFSQKTNLFGISELPMLAPDAP
jgi:hypothetical protein